MADKKLCSGGAPVINADCQGVSLMYFSFIGSVSNAHCFGVFSSSNESKEAGEKMMGDRVKMLLPNFSTFMAEDVCLC